MSADGQCVLSSPVSSSNLSDSARSNKEIKNKHLLNTRKGSAGKKLMNLGKNIVALDGVEGDDDDDDDDIEKNDDVYDRSRISEKRGPCSTKYINC